MYIINQDSRISAYVLVIKFFKQASPATAKNESQRTIRISIRAQAIARRMLPLRATTQDGRMHTCSFGLSATSHQYFSLRTNQPAPVSSHQPTELLVSLFSLLFPPVINKQIEPYFS
jgi:hypothetical protein